MSPLSPPLLRCFTATMRTSSPGECDAHSRFQIGLAEQDADGQFFVSLMAFGLEARTSMTQVLFFRARQQDVTLRHYSGRVTINTTVLDGIGQDLATKLADHARSYIGLLEL